MEVTVFRFILVLRLPRTSLLRFWVAHQLVELLVVEFLTLAVLNVNFDVFVVEDAICGKHASEHVTLLVFLAFIFALKC